MEDYDRLCVRSWIACGFHIISINGPDEIPALAARHPEVEFVATERNAQPLFGRKTPFINDMLSALSRENAPVLGIVNSDIVFEPAPSWHRLESLIAGKSVVTGQRYDTRNLTGGALHRYLPGFDYFFFGHAASAELAKDARPFSMGLPWWDYWFPLVLGLRGYDIHCLTRPAVLHLAHESQTEARSGPWRRLAIECARAVVDEPKAGDPELPPHWQDLLVLCRELAEASDDALVGDALDERIVHLSELSVSVVAAKIEEIGDGAGPAFQTVPIQGTHSPLAPSMMFENLPSRVAAGLALQQAMWEEKHERLNEAQQRYWMAVEKAPQDPGVLTACGNFLFRRGEPRLAAPLLQKAAELAPLSPMILNSLGSALGQLDRTGEAIVCFEKALAADPLYGLSYYNLAIALYPYGHRDIVRRLDERLAIEPNFPEGHDWRRRIAETLEQFERSSAPSAGPVVDRLGNR